LDERLGLFAAGDDFEGFLESARSNACVVQQLQDLVGCELDLFVTPFRRAIMAGDDPRPVQTAEVAIDECVAGLCVVC